MSTRRTKHRPRPDRRLRRPDRGLRAAARDQGRGGPGADHPADLRRAAGGGRAGSAARLPRGGPLPRRRGGGAPGLLRRRRRARRLAGPTAGYLLGFPLAAGSAASSSSGCPRQARHQRAADLPLRGGQQRAVHPHPRHGRPGAARDLTWGEAFDIDEVFWIGDLLKNLAMALVATAVHRAFPDLLGRSRTEAEPDRASPTPA